MPTPMGFLKNGAILLSVLVFTTAASAQFDSSLGVLGADRRKGCLMIRNPSVKLDTSITVVHNRTEPRVSFENLKAGRKLDKDCTTVPAGAGEPDAVFYDVVLPKSALEINGALAIVYIGADARASAAGWKLGGKTVTMRECSSNEGIHFTAWDGKPLLSARLWHFYYYAGIDIEANCKPKDYQK